ncbi:MAG: hypothetical protein ACO1OB_24380, partial [Archangium sp.]
TPKSYMQRKSTRCCESPERSARCAAAPRERFVGSRWSRGTVTHPADPTQFGQRADPTHFIRMFKREHGMTPAAWRTKQAT